MKSMIRLNFERKWESISPRISKNCDPNSGVSKLARAKSVVAKLLRPSILLRLDFGFAAQCCELFSFRCRNNIAFHNIVNGALVFPSSIVRRRHRGGNYHQFETRHCEDKLTAMSPGIMGRLPAQSVDPPVLKASRGTNYKKSRRIK